MAIAIYKTFIAGEVLTAADLNALQNHFVSNATSLVSPFTATVDLDGNTLIVDADGDSSLRATADDVVALRLQGVDAFIFDGDVATPVNGLTFTSSATATPVTVTAQGTDSNIGISIIPKGTGSILLDAAATGNVDIDGAPLIIDADGDSSLRESSDDVLVMKLQNVDVFTYDGDVASPVNGITWRSSATTVPVEVACTGSDSDISYRITPKGTNGTVTIGATDIKPLLYTYATKTGNQAITAATETDITSLTALTLPNTAATLTSRKYLVRYQVPLAESAGANNLIVVKFYNGTNGTKADTLVYESSRTILANALGESITGMFQFSPGAAGRTKFGLSIASGANCAVAATATGLGTIFVQETV